MGEDQDVNELIVPRRFAGPPSSGNGGWTAGALAALLDHDRPDDRAAGVADGPGHAAAAAAARRADAGGRRGRDPATATPVAVAEVVEGDLEPVDPVAHDVAVAAAATYPGFTTHPFPTCFACGPAREEGDGLRIFPGQVDDAGGRTRVAAPWTPHPSVAEDYHQYGDDTQRASLPVTWAALDCVGGWAGDLDGATDGAGPDHGAGPHAAGGRRAARRRGRCPRLRGPQDVHGRDALRLRRVRWSRVAEHVWIAIDPAAFG